MSISQRITIGGTLPQSATSTLFNRLTPIAVPPLTVTADHGGAAVAAEAVT
ncbi:MAG: hypothetical protein AB1941_28710 [Gemmatimonadota bacterium]